MHFSLLLATANEGLSVLKKKYFNVSILQTALGYEDRVRKQKLRRNLQ